MKPTLYADDIYYFFDGTNPYKQPKPVSDTMAAARHILPTRCPLDHAASNSCVHHDDGICDGWLYPDLPEGYGSGGRALSVVEARDSWHRTCEDVWRAMGIVE